MPLPWPIRSVSPRDRGRAGNSRRCRYSPRASRGFRSAAEETRLEPGEIITRVVIPLPPPNELVKLYKISKRKEIDTSTFRAAIRIDAHGGLIRSAAIAYSGLVRGDEAAADRELFWSDGRSPSRLFARPANWRGPRSSRSPTCAAAVVIASSLPRRSWSSSTRKRAALWPGGGTWRINERRNLTGRIAGSASRCRTERARSNVTGRTLYLDDLPPFRNELSSSWSVSPVAHARIVS